MYSKAQGVERDAAEAATWYRQAAEQGNLTAIFWVGSLYLSSEGVEQDLVQAYMCFAVAAALGPQGAQETASRNKEVVAQQTTPEQITEAEELAKIWEPVRSNN